MIYYMYMPNILAMSQRNMYVLAVRHNHQRYKNCFKTLKIPFISAFKFISITFDFVFSKELPLISQGTTY